MRVLIVEDNRRLAESIRDILKHWYDCDICGDGNTGYFLLTDGGYDAAVLDLMLPGMDGITLLKKARKSGCSVPVLILTAKSEIDDRAPDLRQKRLLGNYHVAVHEKDPEEVILLLTQPDAFFRPT